MRYLHFKFGNDVLFNNQLVGYEMEIFVGIQIKHWFKDGEADLLDEQNCNKLPYLILHSRCRMEYLNSSIRGRTLRTHVWERF